MLFESFLVMYVTEKRQNQPTMLFVALYMTSSSLQLNFHYVHKLWFVPIVGIILLYYNFGTGPSSPPNNALNKLKRKGFYDEDLTDNKQTTNHIVKFTKRKFDKTKANRHN